MPGFFSRRYLTRFDVGELPSISTNALVIGSGAAGLRAAIELSNTCDVLIVTKGSSTDCATEKAQGGVAVAMPSAGGVEGHIADTIASGDGLCNEEAVRFIVGAGQEVIDELIGWGAEFDKEGSKLDLAREGGHGAARIIHAHGDATGKEIERCLLTECRKKSNISTMENCFVIDLVSNSKSCFGAIVSDESGQIRVIYADVTILATGGCGRIYREATSPEVCTGDGMALAYRAGVELCGMEFVQFHPTTLYVAGADRALISEVLRGEGGILIDTEGRRFMKDYHPDGELASRDIVCRAVLSQMRKTRATNVFLDISHLPAEFINKRFPEIQNLCVRFDIDISREPVPVRPSAHYMIGGVRTDLEGRAGIAGLYACGEVTCTGFHGANRLGSNSLLEALVMGRVAGHAAARDAKRTGRQKPAEASQSPEERPAGDDLDVEDVRNSLKSLMSRSVGIERNGDGLRAAGEAIEFWGSYVMEKDFEDPMGWELQNMLTVARLIVQAALDRCESRGAHYRVDFPSSSHHLSGRGLG